MQCPVLTSQFWASNMRFLTRVLLLLGDSDAMDDPLPLIEDKLQGGHVGGGFVKDYRCWHGKVKAEFFNLSKRRGDHPIHTCIMPPSAVVCALGFGTHHANVCALRIGSCSGSRRASRV
eukprot:967925-Rhodomonas_salina.2